MEASSLSLFQAAKLLMVHILDIIWPLLPPSSLSDHPGGSHSAPIKVLGHLKPELHRGLGVPPPQSSESTEILVPCGQRSVAAALQNRPVNSICPLPWFHHHPSVVKPAA